MKLGLDTTYQVRAATRKIDIDAASVNFFDKTLGAERHLFHFRRTRERAEHHPAMPRDFGGRFCELCSCLNQRLGCLRPDVAAHHGMTGLLNIFSNRATDGA